MFYFFVRLSVLSKFRNIDGYMRAGNPKIGPNEVVMSHSTFVEPSNANAIIPGHEAELEVELQVQIPLLWIAHKESKGEVKRSREELAQVRRELAEHLHKMKALLARTGRGGMWTAFLKEKEIPRATADRYVAAHEASQQDVADKRLNEAFVEPMSVQVERLVGRILPQLSKVLTTEESTFLFIRTVLDRLPAADYHASERYLEVHCPDRGHAPVYASQEQADLLQ